MVELGLVEHVGVRPRRKHLMVKKCLIVSLAGPRNANFNSFFFVPDDDPDDSSSGSSKMDLETKMEASEEEEEQVPLQHTNESDASKHKPVLIGKKISPFFALLGYKAGLHIYVFFCRVFFRSGGPSRH